MTPRFEFLMDLAVDVGEVVSMGVTPLGERRVVNILGGTFEGPEMRGEVLAGGADWQLARTDGVLDLDAHYALQGAAPAASSGWSLRATATDPARYSRRWHAGRT